MPARRAILVIVAGGLACLSALAQAQAAAGPTRPAAASAATGADQISAPSTRASLHTSQLAPLGPSGSTAASQLTERGKRVDAPPALSAAAQGRDTHVAPVVGRDRCDPADRREASDADCAAIADRRPDDFAAPARDSSGVKVEAKGAAGDLVDAIVGGGTGTVVQLPRN
jgi:hypothetical protein